MDLNQEPLSTPTFPPPDLPLPPKKPPEQPPPLFTFPPVDFEEDTYCPPAGYNLEDFLEKSEVTVEKSARALRHEIINGFRGPLQFRATDPLATWHSNE